MKHLVFTANEFAQSEYEQKFTNNVNTSDANIFTSSLVSLCYGKTKDLQHETFQLSWTDMETTNPTTNRSFAVADLKGIQYSIKSVIPFWKLILERDVSFEVSHLRNFIFSGNYTYIKDT